MDNTLKYESNNGSVIEFKLDSSYHYSDATLHDYERSYTTVGGKITQFYDELQTFTLEAIVAGASADARNDLLEALEYDVQHLKPGKLWSNGYYLECYATASEKDKWWFDAGYMHAKLTFTAEKPKWIHEFYKLYGISRDEDELGIDYAHDYSFDYTSNISMNYAKNTNFCDSPFMLRVYGPTEDPVEIIIGNTVYAVDVTLQDCELLTIDSRNKTIELKAKDGTKTNVFEKRVGVQRKGSGSYIFEPIPAGVNAVSWTHKYIFDLTIYDERVEPKW